MSLLQQPVPVCQHVLAILQNTPFVVQGTQTLFVHTHIIVLMTWLFWVEYEKFRQCSLPTVPQNIDAFYIIFSSHPFNLFWHFDAAPGTFNFCSISILSLSSLFLHDVFIEIIHDFRTGVNNRCCLIMDRAGHATWCLSIGCVLSPSMSSWLLSSHTWVKKDSRSQTRYKKLSYRWKTARRV